MQTPPSGSLEPSLGVGGLGGVDDVDVVLGGLKLPKRKVHGDSTLVLRLQLVHDPSILEGALQSNEH